MYTVYRYEHPRNNEGPYEYNIADVCMRLSLNHNGNNKRPAWGVDGLEFARESGEFFSACDNLKSLKRWFHTYNKDLIKSGFIIAEYLVKVRFVGASGLQCVFNEKDIIERKVVVC